MEILNVSILKNPLNWLVVFMMLLVAAIGFHYIVAYLSGGTASPNPSNEIAGVE